MKKSLIIIAIALSAFTAYGRLTKTIDEMHKYYGGAVEPIPKQKGFPEGGYAIYTTWGTVGATMREGVCISVIYSFDDPINLDQVKAMMESNGRGWVLQNSPSSDYVIYRNEDLEIGIMADMKCVAITPLELMYRRTTDKEQAQAFVDQVIQEKSQPSKRQWNMKKLLISMILGSTCTLALIFIFRALLGFD